MLFWVSKSNFGGVPSLKLTYSLRIGRNPQFRKPDRRLHPAFCQWALLAVCFGECNSETLFGGMIIPAGWWGWGAKFMRFDSNCLGSWRQRNGNILVHISYISPYTGLVHTVSIIASIILWKLNGTLPKDPQDPLDFAVFLCASIPLLVITGTPDLH